MRKLALSVATAVLMLLPSAAALAQQPPQPPVREITKIAGEVYRFRNNNHYSVFAVTPAGVIVTDPIDAGAAQWLKDEIKRRFNQPVRSRRHARAALVRGEEPLRQLDRGAVSQGANPLRGGLHPVERRRDVPLHVGVPPAELTGRAEIVLGAMGARNSC